MQFTIRQATPADADAIAAIHVAAWEGSYRGIVPDEEFEKRPLERRRLQWKQWFADGRYITLLACDKAGEAIGFAGAVLLNDETPYDSYLAVLYVRPELKGRGAGKALLLAIAREMHALGAKSMALRTLRLGTARGFYEKLGARLVPEGIGIESGVFDDVAYAFGNLAALTDAV